MLSPAALAPVKVGDDVTMLDDDRVDDSAPELRATALLGDDAARLAVTTDAGGSGLDSSVEDELEPFAAQFRPALAVALSTTAAAMVVGGIFGSWLARGFGVAAAGIGAGWALFCARSARPALRQAGFPLVVLAVAALTLVGAPGGPGALPTLVGDAIDAGRAIRPPVPFDPGWQVLILLVLGTVAFGATVVAIDYQRPRLGVLIPLPLVALASITQPDSEQFVAGVGAFLPVLAALGVVFGGASQTRDLDRGFEVKRLIRGAIAAVPVLGLLIALNSSSALFPEPRFDPDDQPQKPRAQPLSAAQDRVLFEVRTDTGLTGPWRVGALDVYAEGAWLIPGFNRDRLKSIGGDGAIDSLRATESQLEVNVVVRDLGDSAVVPILAGTTNVTSERELRLDPRSLTLRVPTGRVPANTAYRLLLPAYATAQQLEAVTASPGTEFADQLAIPRPPAEIERLIAAAPPNRWRQLDALRQELLNKVTAKGAGTPVPITPGKVVKLITGQETGTPFEIVAAEAMLARWVGVPSRIGFGFDGLNLEGDVLTVRPKNSAQWLEVWFEGFGWVPLIGSPQKAASSLDADPNARFNPTIEASDDVAVDVYLPFELEDLTLFYEQVRDALLGAAPIAVGVGAWWVGWPVAVKAHRRARRRRWAATRGPRAQIAVEYAEFRDTAIDLGVGDLYDTPIEYLDKVRDDAEHREFAWLVVRTLYGDLLDTATAVDVAAAETMGSSLRRRIAAGQTVEARLLGWVSRASLDQPYTDEIPGAVRVFRGRLTGVGRAARRVTRRLRPLARVLAFVVPFPAGRRRLRAIARGRNPIGVRT